MLNFCNKTYPKRGPSEVITIVFHHSISRPCTANARLSPQRVLVLVRLPSPRWTSLWLSLGRIGKNAVLESDFSVLPRFIFRLNNAMKIKREEAN